MSKEKAYILFTDIAVFLLAYFADTYPLIISIGFFVFCDLFTGAIAAKKRGEKFQSNKLKNTVYKFIAYGMAILIAHVIGKQFMPDLPTLKIMSGFIAYIELKSINENIETVTGINIFGSLIKKLKP